MTLLSHSRLQNDTNNTEQLHKQTTTTNGLFKMISPVCLLFVCIHHHTLRFGSFQTTFFFFFLHSFCSFFFFFDVVFPFSLDFSPQNKKKEKNERIFLFLRQRSARQTVLFWFSVWWKWHFILSFFFSYTNGIFWERQICHIEWLLLTKHLFFRFFLFFLV